MFSPLNTAGTFLVQTLCSFYLMILILRLILQYLRADFYNPISQFVIKLTNPVVMPLRRFLPPRHNFDQATFVFLILFQLFALLLLIWLKVGFVIPHLLGLLIWAVANLVDLTLTLYF